MKFVVNNKIKAFGQTDIPSKKKKKRSIVIEINKKKHKGDKAELADTIKHEILHVKYPKAKEKTVHDMTPARMSVAEQDKMIAKLRMKKLNYKTGAIKRKMKITRKDKVGPGDLIKKANEIKSMNPRKRTAFMGMV